MKCKNIGTTIIDNYVGPRVWGPTVWFENDTEDALIDNNIFKVVDYSGSYISLYGSDDTKRSVNLTTQRDIQFDCKPGMTINGVNVTNNILGGSNGIINFEQVFTTGDEEIATLSNMLISGNIFTKQTFQRANVANNRSILYTNINVSRVTIRDNFYHGAAGTPYEFINYNHNNSQSEPVVPSVGEIILKDNVGVSGIDINNSSNRSIHKGLYASRPVISVLYKNYKYICTDKIIDTDSSSATYLQVISVTEGTGGLELCFDGTSWRDCFGRNA